MAITLTELKRLLRAEVRMYGGIRAFCRAYGCVPSRVSEVLIHDAEPQPHIAAALGYRKARTRYEKVTP